MSWVAHKVLAAIADEGALSTVAITRASGVAGKSLENAIYRLRARAFIALEHGRYRITEPGRAFIETGKRFTSGPRGTQPGRRLHTGTLRERAWRAMRIKVKFSSAEIVALAATDAARDPDSNVGKYLRALERSGYLMPLARREAGTSPTSNGFRRYVLVRNSGPQAPRWLPKLGTVYDPNTEEQHPVVTQRVSAGASA